jgi:hypothetical protein
MRLKSPMRLMTGHPAPALLTDPTTINSLIDRPAGERGVDEAVRRRQRQRNTAKTATRRKQA